MPLHFSSIRRETLMKTDYLLIGNVQGTRQTPLLTRNPLHPRLKETSNQDFYLYSPEYAQPP